MTRTGAQIVAECLIEQGVDTVFGYPGGNVITLYDALYDYSDRIHHVLTAHEQGATHAADGYARTTGRPGVVIATSGPGATNLVTGIATAFMDSIPMVAITGNVTNAQLGKDTFQEIDIFGVTMPVTKYNFIIKDIAELADALRRAFEIAMAGRRGPVLVDILKDVFAATADFEPKTPARTRPMAAPEDDIAAVAALIDESKRPMIYAGGGVISAEASDELRALAQKIGAPVTLSLMGLGAFPADDPMFTGMIGMHGTKVSSLALNACDLLLVAGARFSDRVISDPKHFAKNAKIIHMDADAAEVNKNIRVHRAVVGDIRHTLAALNGRVEEAPRAHWAAQIALWKREYPRIEESNALSPQYIIDSVAGMMGEDDIVATDVGQHQIWTAQCYPVKKPRTFISSGGLGTMGFGLGAAIGAQMAHPERRVVLFTGDGSFHMNMNELITASMNGLPIVIVLMNNGVLGMVRQWQKVLFNRRYSQTTLKRKTDYIKLAEAFGCAGFTVERKEDLIPTLEKAFAAGVPALVNCLIDMDANVLPMVPAGKPIDDPILRIEN